MRKESKIFINRSVWKASSGPPIIDIYVTVAKGREPTGNLCIKLNDIRKIAMKLKPSRLLAP